MNITKMSKILLLALFIALGILGYIQPASAQRISGSELVTTAVPGISLNKAALTLKVGGASGTLVAAVSQENDVNQAVTWTTSNAAVATVANGIVTPIGTGTATITAATQDGAYSAASPVTEIKATASESLGVAAHLNEFYYNYPLFEGMEAPASALTVIGSAADDDFTGYSVNTFDATRNASFVVAPFNSYPAMSTIPSQGLTMDISSDKNCVITNVDGYTLGLLPNSVTVGVNSLGEVSVNDVTLWKAQSGYKIVGYLPGTASNTATLIEENLSDLTDFMGVNVPSVGSDGSQVAAWTLPSKSLPGNFEEFLGFNVNSDGQLQPMVASYFGNNNKFAPYSTNGSPLAAGVFAPVEVAQVYASDKVVETSTITVSNSLNGKVATVTVNFQSSRPISGLIPFLVSPSSVNEVLGGSQTITVSFANVYGNPLANSIVYLETGIPGLWLTQVNGKTITSQINMGTLSSPSIQTVNTPVPLFNLGAWASAPAYSSITVRGLTAYHLNNDKAPVIALTTGDDGTVSFTLAEGDVTYVAKTVSTTALNSYRVDPGTAIDHQYLGLSLYSPSTFRWGATLLNWTNK